MGRSPINSKAKGKKSQTRIMSFNDARRATGRASIRLDGSDGSQKTRQMDSDATVATRKISPRLRKNAATSTAEAPAKASPKPRRKPPAAKVAKASAPKARRSNSKSIRIARGEVREGALSFMSDEEIEQRAAAEKHEEKEAKRKESRLAKFAESRKKQAEEKRRAKNKAKAERQFDKTYGADQKAAAAASEAGPRAAVYKAEMGSAQKKSAKMQMKDAAGKIAGLGSRIPSIPIPKFKLPDSANKVWRAAIGAGIVVVFAISLYGPAQQYYLQMRETDRLQAEYVAVAERSNFLQSSIDSLSSDEGIEDKAHTDLGYVKKNEQTASVKGLNLVDTTEFTSNVAPGSIPAPDTWYSAFLDPIFGYSH